MTWNSFSGWIKHVSNALKCVLSETLRDSIIMLQYVDCYCRSRLRVMQHSSFQHWASLVIAAVLSTIHLLLQHSRRLLKASGLCVYVYQCVCVCMCYNHILPQHSDCNRTEWSFDFFQVLTVFCGRPETSLNPLFTRLIAFCICIHTDVLLHTRVG